MIITNIDKKKFRAIGHKLKPIVMIAQKGLSETVGEELDRALENHELIKVKIAAGERDDKKALTIEICKEFKAECIQSVGNIVLLYRPSKKPDPKLSNLKRRLA
ncbi:MAG: RNA-binding protein [Pseudohongiellaceae bacterium]|jgi:RNA-binding protein